MPETIKGEERSYIVTAIDRLGDTLIFVSSALYRAEARYEAMVRNYVDVRASWHPNEQRPEPKQNQRQALREKTRGL